MTKHADLRHPHRDPTANPPIHYDHLPDRTALRRIQTALWAKEETRGAAVMIGSGLTRTAQRAAHDAPLPPTWRDLANDMAAHLYPTGNAPRNPLTIAQEYAVTLGRPALNDLIRARINDQALTPGRLHHALIALPWTDILTTNWDTLLERAVRNNPQHHYELVQTINDIPRTRAPRIIKLHGTLPSHTPFIITEEDFRTYPTDFAPFVNLAQQILMENVLCLIGFSGDDPNFLQWTGWVRDHLGEHAPPIYLIGALALTQPTRRRLEARGVTPIDFAPVLTHLDTDDRHAEAIGYFLKALTEARPWPAQRWPTQPQHPANKKEPLLEKWKKLRSTYPGWIVAPRIVRIHVNLETRANEHTLNQILKTAITEEQHALLYEFAWRLDIGLLPFPPEILEQLGQAATGTSLDRTKRDDLTRWLLRNAREQDDHEALTTWERWIEQNAPRLQHYLAWERCLHARDTLNLKTIEEHRPLVEGEDPIWTLRRAALHAELNNKKQATNEALDALRELRTRQAQDQHSIWIASRLAWALFFCQALASPWNDDKRLAEELGEAAKEWPSDLTAKRCDPWQEREGIREELRQARERQQRDKETIEYPFDPGQATRTTHHFLAIPQTAHIEARRLFDRVGIPRGILNLNITRDELETAITIEGTTTPTQMTRLISSRPTRKLVDEQLSRLAIARLPNEVVGETISRLRPALTDTIRRYRQTPDENMVERVEWINRAANIAEILSRLIIRTNTTTIQQTINETLTTIRETPEHWTLAQKLHLLIHRGIAALPPEEQSAFLLATIEPPLPGEDGAEHPDHNLPEPIDAFTNPKPDRSADEQRWARRIEGLTQLVASRGIVRERAIYRLFKLNTWQLLTEKEQHAFAQNLWLETSEEKLPTNTGLFSHVFLYLPEPTPGRARRAFEHEVIELNQPHQPTARDLVAVLNAARYIPEPHRYLLSRTQAQTWLARMLEKVTQFAHPQDAHPLSAPTEAERFLAWGGRAIAGAVLPALAPEDLTDEIIGQLMTVEAPGIVEALPGLVAVKPELQGAVVDRLRDLLVGAEAEWGHAAAAVLEWSRLDHEGNTKVPDDLVSLVTGAVLSRHRGTLANTLAAATELVRQGRLSGTDQARLESGLTYLFSDLDYSGTRAGEYDEVSLLRARCAMLALALKQAGRAARIIDEWLATAAHDPLPDVRSASREPQ
ncbi:MAG TPA: SIR2 family protein [Thermoanaerobaculales bacterium]|nr:SIR2 family protein [Thermoanaerobaculales bacterium]